QPPRKKPSLPRARVSRRPESGDPRCGRGGALLRGCLLCAPRSAGKAVRGRAALTASDSSFLPAAVWLQVRAERSLWDCTDAFSPCINEDRYPGRDGQQTPDGLLALAARPRACGGGQQADPGERHAGPPGGRRHRRERQRPAAAGGANASVRLNVTQAARVRERRDAEAARQAVAFDSLRGACAECHLEEGVHGRCCYAYPSAGSRWHYSAWGCYEGMVACSVNYATCCHCALGCGHDSCGYPDPCVEP
ncbi:unnamed protein product, partial [Prorocentrum cordatum]